MIITKEILEQGRSMNGGWNNKQIASLGVPSVKTRRFNKGWKKRLIGADVPEENIEKFLSLKDAHLQKGKYARNVRKENNSLFERQGKIQPTEENICQFGTPKYNCKTCFHYKCKCCDGLADLSKVCSHWYSPESEIVGLHAVNE